MVLEGRKKGGGGGGVETIGEDVEKTCNEVN